MTVRVLGLASGTTSLEDHRHAIAALLTQSGSMQSRGGVFAGAGGDLVTVSAMAAKVTPFYAWVDGGSSALQAGYDVTSDADVTLTFADGEAGVARVDRVIARVRQDAYDASTFTDGAVAYLKGQASGAATALPPSAELLWEVTVPAGASAGTGGINFTTARTDKRRWTVASGGMLPVKDQTERDAVTAPYDGMSTWRRDRKWVEIYDGTAWRVKGVGTVASNADRSAITNPYDGQVIARTDRDWIEFYDGAAWRVQGTPVVAAFADLATYITNPVNGQTAFNTGDGMLYRYNSTAVAWRVVDYRPPTQTLAGTQPTITFSSIPSYLRRLKLYVTSRADSARTGQWLYLRFNGDPAGTTNYRSAYISTGGNSTSFDTAQIVAGFMPGASMAAGVFGSAVIDIVGWDSPHSGFLGVNTQTQVIQDASNTFVTSGGGQYKPAGPYTSLTILPEAGNFVAGTEVTLEGTP